MALKASRFKGTKSHKMMQERLFKNRKLSGRTLLQTATLQAAVIGLEIL